MIKDLIADQLVYSTVRIVCRNSTAISQGTGFFMIKSYEDGSNVSAIVTNNHVVDGYDYAEFTLAGTDENGNPDDINHVVISVDNLQKRCVSHLDPTIDICLLFINDKINESVNNGRPVYYKAINSEMTLLSTDLESLTPIEDVVMIGYPNGIIDTYNNKPVVRKGISATSVKLDYNGNPEFMIDIACFFGSSGSPVFLRKEGLAKEQSENGITLGLSPSYSLLGIIHSMSIAKANGEILVKDIPTSLKPTVETNIPLNLGQVTKARKIIEIFDQVKMK